MTTGREQGTVLHLVPALFDAHDGIIGGAERYVLELARHMANVVPTRLVTFGDRERDERIGSLEVRVIGGARYVRGQRSNPVSPALIGEVRRARVIHCHQQHVVMSSVAAATARLFRARVFCTDLGGGGWDVSAYVSTDRWYHGHLHISEYSRRIAGHADAPWAHVVLGGVDAAKFSPDPATPRDGTVLFVGRLLPHKGVNDLIDAIQPGVRAEIIGPAADQRYLAELESRAAGRQIRFRFDCDDRALVEAYRRAACVVLPSVYRDMYGAETKVPELLGQTLLEGMACGAPAICTDVASLPEVVENGVTGLVVAPNDPAALKDAICWMLSHPEHRQTMGEQGRRRVMERFSWNTVVRRCLEAYAA
ncbi:MAG TPA: glycosyltransferase family 4 protein [Vicinamibacterales bacterium]|nr:glycosyltransferase family 4 protein [Vicinamibacterales bacterium]